MFQLDRVAFSILQ